MFLFVFLLLSTVVNCSDRAPDRYLDPIPTIIVPGFRLPSAAVASSTALTSSSGDSSSTEALEEELCHVTLSSFMKRTDSDLTKYIKPQLLSLIKEATSSPDNNDEDENEVSPKRFFKKMISNPDQAKNVPRQELDEVVLAAVKKAFEEKELDIERKSKKIEKMFSKKSTALITTVTTVIVTIASSLGSAYGVMNNPSNCTK